MRERERERAYEPFSFTFYVYISLRPREQHKAARRLRGGRDCYPRTVLVAGAPLCVAIFSATGLLKADNRMRNINHSIHLISAIIYTEPRFTSSLTRDVRVRTDRRENHARERTIKRSQSRISRRSNKIFTIPNKLPTTGHPCGHSRIQITGVSPGPDDTICAVLIPRAVVRRNKMDDKARSPSRLRRGSRGRKRQT